MNQRSTKGQAALLLAFGLLMILPLSARAQSAETLVLFDAAKLETPENLAFDRHGNLYISLALTGEIRKITPEGVQSTFAQLPIGAPLTPCGGFIGLLGGIAIDNRGNLYVSAALCDLGNRGIWKITPDGQAAILAHLPGDALPNGITLHHDRLYVADSALGRVWTVPVDGGTPSVWIQDNLLFTAPGSPFPGANGIKVYHGEVYVAVSGTGTIVAIPFLHNDLPGAPRIHAHLPAPQGCDDFAFDVHGSLYCTTDPFLTVIRVDPDGSSEILLTAADGLDGPTATAFGVHGQDRFNLYITNGAFPFFSVAHRPSLMRLRLDVPGAPLEH